MLGRDRLHRFSPQQAAFQHVRLIDQRDPLFPSGRCPKGHLGDPLNLVGFIHHRVHRPFAGTLLHRLLGLAEIEPAGQFPDHEHVKTTGHPIRPQGRAARQFGIQHRRAQVGVQPKDFSQRQQSRPLRLLVGGQRLPFRPAHTSKQHRRGGFAQLHRLVRQRFSFGIDRRPAHQPLLPLQFESVGVLGGLGHLKGRVHYFRPDPVPG